MTRRTPLPSPPPLLPPFPSSPPVGGGILPFTHRSGGMGVLPFSCVSYEVTKRVLRLQRVSGVGLYWSTVDTAGSWPKTLPLISNFSYSIPFNPFYKSCNMLLTGLQHSLQIPPHFGNHHHHAIQ